MLSYKHLLKNSILLLSMLVFTCVNTPLIYATKKSKEYLSIHEIGIMDIEELMNVKISTAGKRPQEIGNIPASLVIITRKDIETYGYSSLEEILKNINGMFEIDDLGPYRSTFGVRGFWTGFPKNVHFLVNGLSQSDGFFNYHVLSNFNIPVEAIDRIEVIRGPMSIVYGQDSFFGAINIITNDFEAHRSLNHYSVSYGSLGTKKIFARACSYNDDYNFALNAGYHNTDGIDEPLHKMTSKPHTLKNYGINENNNTTKHRLESKSKYFNFSGKLNHFYTNASLNVSDNEFYAPIPTFSKGNSYKRQMAKISGAYHNTISEQISLQSKLTYHNFSFKFDGDFLSNQDSGFTDGNSEIYEMEFNTFLYLTEDIDISFDMYYKIIANNQHICNLHDFSRYLHIVLLDDIKCWAAALHVDYALFKKLRLLWGIRLDKQYKYDIDITVNPGNPNESTLRGTYQDDDIEIIPRFAAIYKMTSDNIFKFLYGQAISRSSFAQVHDRSLIEKKPYETEHIETFEMNYIATPFNNLIINASIFKNVLDNLVVRNLLGTDNQFVIWNDNTGKKVTHGADLTLQMKIYDNISGELSGTYQKTKEYTKNHGKIDASYSPNFLGYLKLSYVYDDFFTCGITGRYVDRLKTLWDVAKLNSDGTYGARIGEDVDDYFLMDVNFRFDDIYKKGLFFNVKAENIFNTKYTYPSYTTNISWIDKGTPGNSQSFLVTAGCKF